jgi:long-subunit acyl-CoA synthetase (AMP-forming)
LIRIVRPGTDEDLPDGEIGELLVRGPCTIRGYYNAPDRDAEAFTADGFYRSGDLMSFTTIDGVRNLVFKGRVKDVIDRGGEKINCGEVEAAIGLHPAVGAVACVAMPDPMYGERMCAFIVPQAAADDPTLNTIGKHLAALGFAKFKWPERIELVPELPMTTSGKVSKPRMRELITAKLAQETATGERSATKLRSPNDFRDLPRQSRERRRSQPRMARIFRSRRRPRADLLTRAIPSSAFSQSSIKRGPQTSWKWSQALPVSCSPRSNFSTANFIATGPYVVVGHDARLRDERQVLGGARPRRPLL